MCTSEVDDVVPDLATGVPPSPSLYAVIVLPLYEPPRTVNLSCVRLEPSEVVHVPTRTSNFNCPEEDHKFHESLSAPSANFEKYMRVLDSDRGVTPVSTVNDEPSNLSSSA